MPMVRVSNGGTKVQSVSVFREGGYTIISNSASNVTFTATNITSTDRESYVQWYIGGSNDLNNWTTLNNERRIGTQVYNFQKTVNVAGYKYLKFGTEPGTSSSPQWNNYMSAAQFKNIVFS